MRTDVLETDIAWLAGLFDGEGHIGCLPTIRSGLQVIIQMKDKATLDRVYRLAGGNIQNPRPQGIWRWVISSNLDALSFLKLIAPFSVTKKDQIDLVLKQEAIWQPPINQRLAPSILEARKQLHSQLMALHHV